MVMTNKMAKRRCAVQGSSFGFYAEFGDSNDDMSLRGAQFYEVERLVDRKIRKGCVFYLVLWKGYKKEEATWVRSEDVTDYAIKLYHDPPSPDSRLVSDHISELTSSMKYSLSGEFTGKKAKNKPGKLYERKDFPHFPDSAFTYYNKDGEGCFVLFPVYMHLKIKYGPLHYDINGNIQPRNFTEILCVVMTKTRSD